VSNHRKRGNYYGEEKIAALGTHFIEGLLQEHWALLGSNPST
jgi:hypothetical protein